MSTSSAFGFPVSHENRYPKRDLGQIGIKCDNIHHKSPGKLRNIAAYLTYSDNTQGLIIKFHPHIFVLLPPARSRGTSTEPM
jgi:hypothetical protein